MTKKVLVAIPVEQRHKEYLEQETVGRCSFIYKKPSEVTVDDLALVNAIVGNVPAPLLKDAKELELLQLNSAGTDSYTASGIMPAGVRLCNATGAYSLSVGEHMLALTFDLIRHLAQYRDRQKAHKWQDCGRIISVEGATVAVLGFGDIGSFYARKMKALGAACVIGVKRTIREKPEFIDELYTIEDLDKILSRADIVAMVLPSGNATDNLMDERRLRLMKRGAYLINVGRGNSIDETALQKVLSDGHLGGAALDVTSSEPLPEDSPLWEQKNLFITPHIAGSFFLQETFERIVRISGFNLRAWLNGEMLKNEVKLTYGV